MKIPRPRRYAFIDSQNVNLGIRSQGWELDFEKFRRYLLEKCGVVEAFLFIGYLPSNQTLYTFLQRIGFILIFKPTLILPGGIVKRNVDAELVLHTMIEYPNYEEAIIVTGDGDFACLVEYLVKQEKMYRLLVPRAKSCSSLLKKVAAGKLDVMDNLRQGLERKSKRGSIAPGQNPADLPSS